MQQQQIISQSDCNMCWKVEFIQQPATTISVVGPRRSSKALPKVKLAPEKVMVTVWWSAAHLSHYSFLNPGKTITSEKYAQQIDVMYQKLQCLQPALVNKKGPIFLHNHAQPHITQPMLQKLNELGYELLPHLLYSPTDLSPTDYHFKYLNNFLQGKMLPWPAKCRKCFPRVHWSPTQIFMLQE